MGLAERKVFGFPDLRTRQGVQMGEENEEEGSQYFITVSYTHLDVYKRQAYIKNGKYCVVNNTYEAQSTTVYKGDGTAFQLDLEPNQIIWYEI